MDGRQTLEDKFGKEFISELLIALEFSAEDEDLFWALSQGEEWAFRKFFMQGGANEAGVPQPSFIRNARCLEYLQRIEQSSPVPISMPARATFQALVGPEEFARILAHFAPDCSDSNLYTRYLACLRVLKITPDYEAAHTFARRFTAGLSGTEEAESAMQACFVLASLGSETSANELVLFKGLKALESAVSAGQQLLNPKKPHRGFWKRLFGR